MNDRTVFVGGISWKVLGSIFVSIAFFLTFFSQAKEENLKSFFSTFGTVTECKIIVDKNSNKSKGYGFVTFEDAETAEKVKKSKDLNFMGKTMNASDAYRKTENTKKSPNPYGNGMDPYASMYPSVPYAIPVPYYVPNYSYVPYVPYPYYGGWVPGTEYYPYGYNEYEDGEQEGDEHGGGDDSSESPERENKEINENSNSEDLKLLNNNNNHHPSPSNDNEESKDKKLSDENEGSVEDSQVG